MSDTKDRLRERLAQMTAEELADLWRRLGEVEDEAGPTSDVGGGRVRG